MVLRASNFTISTIDNDPAGSGIPGDEMATSRGGCSPRRRCGQGRSPRSSPASGGGAGLEAGISALAARARPWARQPVAPSRSGSPSSAEPGKYRNARGVVIVKSSSSSRPVDVPPDSLGRRGGASDCERLVAFLVTGLVCVIYVQTGRLIRWLFKRDASGGSAAGCPGGTGPLGPHGGPHPRPSGARLTAAERELAARPAGIRCRVRQTEPGRDDVWLTASTAG